MNLPIHLTLVATLLSILLSSCSVSGPDYTSARASGALTPHNGKGMVLIYRSKGLAASGSKPYIWVNQAQMPSRLARGGFYSYEAAPGPLNLTHSFAEVEPTSETRKKATIEGFVSAGIVGAVLAGGMDVEARRKVTIAVQVRPGRTHYVTMDRLDRPLREVQQSEVGTAMDELSDCHWLNPKLTVP